MKRDEDLGLHLKYRPQTFDEIVGNESTISSLKSVLDRKKGEIRAFLLIGHPGCGKTTTGRIIAQELGCTGRDFYEYNSADTRKIEDIRAIIDNSKYAPFASKVKVYLLDEAHKITTDGKDALLKELEDTPKHVRYILCTTEPEKIPAVIKQRCQSFNFAPLKRSEIMKLLKWVCANEKVDVSDELLSKITDFSEGVPRQALVMLDQVIDLESDQVAIQTLIDASVEEATVLDLCQKLLMKTKWDSFAKILKNFDEDPEKIRYAVLSYMSKVLLSKDDPKAAQIIDLFSETWMYTKKAGMIKDFYLACKL